jgi:cell division protein FtsX
VRRIEYFLRETLQAFWRNGFVVFAAISTAFIAVPARGAILVRASEQDRRERQANVGCRCSSTTKSRARSSQHPADAQPMPQTKTVSYESKDEAYQVPGPVGTSPT